MDNCASSPCGNSAMCHNLPVGYVCKCTEGFHRVNCQEQTTRDTSTCPPVPECRSTTDGTSSPSRPEVTTCPSCPEVTTPAAETTTFCPTPEPEP